MRLDLFRNPEFSPGASLPKRVLWLILSGLLVESWLPGSRWRVALLRLFGAKLGQGIVIKPGVKVKFPWRLRIGDHSWIGERAWIDNLDQVAIGNHVCISQSAYLCTGSHDWHSKSFDLIVKPITIQDHAWICAFTTLAPGSRIGEGAVVAMGGNASGEIADWMIWTAGSTRPRRNPS